MKIIFFGTPEFAAICLHKLIANQYNIPLVVTIPDKQKGRGQKISYSPIKSIALENRIPILQPENLKDESLISQLQSLESDVGVVVAFKILPKEIYTIPKFGMINLHASLLPKYRGAAPIQWALINGEKETGLTTFFLQEKVDTGNIILQEKVLIEEEDNFESLHNKMASVGSDLIIKTLELISLGNVPVKQQDASQATLAPKITKELCLIDWNRSAEEIHNLIRGLSPIPGAHFEFKDKIIKIFKTKIRCESNLKPGKILQTENSLIIGCGRNSLEISELQQEGKKRLKVEEFLRGFSFVA
jgi:methionyl-tRNA formyltransferase